MYERILVPLDGSELAEGILSYAKEVAKKFDSEIILLRAVKGYAELVGEMAIPGDVPTSTTVLELESDIAQQTLDNETASGQSYLDRICRQLREENVRSKTTVVEGAAAPGILAYSNDADVSLIAMSTHGRGGLQRLMFGSVADEVVRNARVPLLLIHPDDKALPASTGRPTALSVGHELSEPVDLVGEAVV